MNQSQSRPTRIVAIEGNIGAGKSTFLSFLTKVLPDVEIIAEPVDEWQNINGHNLLELYYKDLKRWSFTFQTFAMISRMRLWDSHLKLSPTKLKLSQRSMLADRHVFGELMGDMGNVLPVEMEAYKQIAQQVLSSWPLQGIIYLKCSPETCLRRIQRRNRFQEQSVPLEYLQKVDQKYELLIQKHDGKKVLVIDTQQYNVQGKEDQAKIKTLIEEFFATLN